MAARSVECRHRVELSHVGCALRTLPGCRLLDPPPELVARFKHVPASPEMWDRFRPFAEGRSYGAGDPADGFCRDASDPGADAGGPA